MHTVLEKTHSESSVPVIRQRGVRCGVVINVGPDIERLRLHLNRWAPLMLECEHEMILVNDCGLQLEPVNACIANLKVVNPECLLTNDRMYIRAARDASAKYLLFVNSDAPLDRLTIRKWVSELEATGSRIAASADRDVLLVETQFARQFDRCEDMFAAVEADPQLTGQYGYHHGMISDLARHEDISGKSVLVIGCSYGLECELFRRAGAARVVGVDTYDNLGIYYRHGDIEYVKVSAQKLPFADASFDICSSIATLEHIPDPRAAIKQMLRVTAPGGLIYCHAAPLWHSPHGHHKDNYFPDPWIHLRARTPEEMKNFYRSILDRPAEGVTISELIDWLYDCNDCNRAPLAQYRAILHEIAPAVQPIRIDFHMLDRNLLTQDLRSELREYASDELLTDSLIWILRPN